MRKVIFAINITINGFADHTVGIADEELHDFFTNLLKDVDIILYGRKTYQLMEDYWPLAHDHPGSTESMKRFADKINPLQKIVFSKTLTEVKWENSILASGTLKEKVTDLKSKDGKTIAVGSLSIASQLFKQNLIDEFWFPVHPVVAGKGPRLFDGIDDIKNLQFVNSQKLKSGVIVLHYKNSESN